MFADTFKLRPLAEVEQYVGQNKHLPGIPSAAQVQAEGIELGAMQAKVLQKVEELTLYIIELKKENEQLKRDVALLMQQNASHR